MGQPFKLDRSISEQLLEHGIRLRSYAAGDHRSTCPKCSAQRKNKKDECLSVTIDGDSAVWNCWHCASDLGIPFTGSVRLAGGVHAGFTPKAKRVYDLPTTAQKMVDEEAILEWFLMRGLSRKTVTSYNVAQALKYSEGNQRLMIAFNYYRDNELVSVKYRRAVHEKPYGYSQDKGTEQIFYGLHMLPEAPDELIICEGEVDALSVYEATGKPALSVPAGGQTEYKGENDKSFHFLEDQRELIDAATRIVVMTDADEAGRGLANEMARRIGKNKCFRVRFPEDCKDANEVLLKHGPTLVGELIEYAEPWPIAGVHSVWDYEDEVMADYDGLSFEPLSTGFPNLDPYFKVLDGQISIVTGIPNSGKSEFLDHLILNMAQNHGWKFGICSFENKPQHHIRKFLEKHTGAPFFSEGPTKRMSKEEIKTGMGWLNRYFKFIRYNDWRKATPTIDSILDQARMLVMRHGIKGLVIDPYNELDRPMGENSETEYVSIMLAKVRQFAESHDCHVWFVAHPKKMVTFNDQDVPVPTAYDIAGSARWADKGDVIWAVSRDRRDTSKPVEVHVHKVRDKYVGQVGCAYFHYNRMNGRYSPAPDPIAYPADDEPAQHWSQNY